VEVIAALGRIVFGLFFVLNGINHFARFPGMVQYASAYQTPAPGVAVAVTGVMLLLGGLSFTFGYLITVGAWLLAIFLVAAAFQFHAYWKVDDAMQRANQMAHFGKNLALAGAALALTLVQGWWRCGAWRRPRTARRRRGRGP